MAAQIRVAPSGSQVADGIYRLGDHYVNWYVLEDGADSRSSTPACPATGGSSPHC